MNRLNWITVVLTLFFVNLGKVAFSQDIVAEVAGEPITRSELAERLIRRAGRAELEALIAEKLLQQAAAQKGVSVSESEVSARLQLLQQNAGSVEQFNQQLEALGITLAIVRQQIQTQILGEKVLGLAVSDEEIQRYFELNRPRLDFPARVRLRRLVVNEEAKARQAHERLKRGESFTKVTAEMSDYPDVRANQGEFGVWQQYGGVDSVIEEYAFKLQKGQYSESFPYGSDFYILYAEEMYPAQPATLENSRERIRAILLTRKWQSAFPAWIAEQRRKVPIKIYLESK